MKRNKTSGAAAFVLVQVVVVAAFGAGLAVMSPDSKGRLKEVVTGEVAYVPVKIEREVPIRIEPLYDDENVVSDKELAAVLSKIQPVFASTKLRPNYVEHALRTWHMDAEFQNPNALSGKEMVEFLLDHGRFLLSWDPEIEPLLQDRDTGVFIRWGKMEGASVHHDHTLACLTEAGVPLSHPVRTPGNPNLTLKNVLEQAMYDFEVDEWETEWSTMAFGFWLPPVKSWENANRRKINFDLIAKRQLRGHKQYGVCGGTHRVYSLMCLIRLDDQFSILSDGVRTEVLDHLRTIRDILEVTQFEDGHWPYNWPDGKDAVEHPDDYPAYRDVIATGHHLEWLAIAPEDLHPPKEMIHKAADWIVKNTTSKSHEEILDNYTFYSHVGNALALWRNTRAPVFWKAWEAEHPWQAEEKAADDEGTDGEKTEEAGADDKGDSIKEQPAEEEAAANEAAAAE